MLALRSMPLVLLLAAGLFLIPAASRGAAPNFIVFIADDMGWNDCGAYGHPHIRTPNIDRLAASGLRLDRAYLTCSSCSPSRCSILTGRYPHSTGAGELHLPLPASQTLLTTPLRQAGYWTAAVGKWHLGEQVADQVDYRQGSPPPKMGQAWVEALRQRPKDQPFFLWAAHSDPHRGYQAGAVEPPHTRQEVIVPPFLPDTPEVRDDLALYYDEVSRFDEHIGQVVEELHRQAIVDNTVIMVISDNGRPFPFCKTRVNVPGVRTPMVIAWPAALNPGQTSLSVVSSVDLAPTILELAGLDPLESFQGVSFAGLLTDPTRAPRQFAFAEHNWHDYRAFERAVHSDRYCYIRNWLPEVAGTPPADAVRSPTYEVMQQRHAAGELPPEQRDCFETPRPEEFLYDVVADPHCLDNLVGSTQHARELATLREALEAWQSETMDVFPGPEHLTPDGFDRQTGERLIQASHPSQVSE